MHKLKIYQLIFTKSDCYKSGIRQKQCGVQVHSTGANNPWLRRYVGPDDGRLGVNQYGNHSNQPGGTVCANAYIGKLMNGEVAVYQTLPWDMRCWLSGKGKNGGANKIGYAGFEICEDNLQNDSYFKEAVLDKAVLLTAHLCDIFGVTPYEVIRDFPEGPALAVMDHHELHDIGLASNHGDIQHWLKKYGLSMNYFRDCVQVAMEEGVEAEYIPEEKETIPMDEPTLRRGSTGEAVRMLQGLLGGVEIDGVFGAQTEDAVKQFQRQNGLTADGIVGTKTWKALKSGVTAPADDAEKYRKALLEIRTKAKEITDVVDKILAET